MHSHHLVIRYEHKTENVITAANEHGLAMLFTGVRHFRH